MEVEGKTTPKGWVLSGTAEPSDFIADSLGVSLATETAHDLRLPAEGAYQCRPEG